MKYRFKPLPELYWSVVTAVSIVLLTGLVTLDPEAVTDWRAWAVALGGGAVRAGAGAAIDWIRRSMADGPAEDLTESVKALSPEKRAKLGEMIEHLALDERIGRQD